MRPTVALWARLGLGIASIDLILNHVDLRRLTVPWSDGALLGLFAVTALQLVAQAASTARWMWILGEGAPPWRYLYRL